MHTFVGQRLWTLMVSQRFFKENAAVRVRRGRGGKKGLQGEFNRGPLWCKWEKNFFRLFHFAYHSSCQVYTNPSIGQGVKKGDIFKLWLRAVNWYYNSEVWIQSREEEVIDRFFGPISLQPSYKKIPTFFLCWFLSFLVVVRIPLLNATSAHKRPSSMKGRTWL